MESVEDIGLDQLCANLPQDVLEKLAEKYVDKYRPHRYIFVLLDYAEGEQLLNESFIATPDEVIHELSEIIYENRHMDEMQDMYYQFLSRYGKWKNLEIDDDDMVLENTTLSSIEDVLTSYPGDNGYKEGIDNIYMDHVSVVFKMDDDHVSTYLPF